MMTANGVYQTGMNNITLDSRRVPIRKFRENPADWLQDTIGKEKK